MKEKIHPKYNNKVRVTCACGTTFETGSVKNEIKVDVCSACHPFYTGQQRTVQARGRVEKFNRRYGKE
ncbi:MAG: 50S ribosomal protein L31 [Negativicutes bacterium]|nr:50S ribosomal protein L31 [Negativicutes bacterium]